MNTYRTDIKWESTHSHEVLLYALSLNIYFSHFPYPHGRSATLHKQEIKILAVVVVIVRALVIKFKRATHCFVGGQLYHLNPTGGNTAC